MDGSVGVMMGEGMVNLQLFDSDSLHAPSSAASLINELDGYHPVSLVKFLMTLLETVETNCTLHRSSIAKTFTSAPILRALT